MGHAKVLLGIEDAALQAEAAVYVTTNGLSVRETEAYIKQLLNPVEKKEKKSFGNEEVYRQITERMQEKTGTKVRIVQKDADKGKVEIEYYSNSDLERIIELLG